MCVIFDIHNMRAHFHCDLDILRNDSFGLFHHSDSQKIAGIRCKDLLSRLDRDVFVKVFVALYSILI